MSLRNKLLSGRSGKQPPRGQSPADCTPVKWDKYFDEHNHVEMEDGTFHYYKKGTDGPLIVAIHGGGYSGLTWALLADDIVKKIECRVLAVDLRGHGNTITNDEDNLSLNQLANDIKNMIDRIYDYALPPIILVGHSLGGAVAVETATMIENLVGLCVIDVVEGTALESLSSMQSLLRSRPSGFKTIQQAIQWGYRGGSTHNIEAARVSMPGQIKNIESGKLAAEETDISPEDDHATGDATPRTFATANSINEEEETGNGSETSYVPAKISPSKPVPNKYTWRIDLSKTEPYWGGWFKGLSQKFLNVSVPKILLLANIFGLDTTLTVGQMQGKFQFQVLPKSGHAIHEDQPDHVADIISSFLVRQKLTSARTGFTPIPPGC